MISLSFFCLLALASALPPHRELASRSIDHTPARYELIKAANVPQPLKRTDSTGADEQASVLVCEHIFWAGACETKTYNLGTDECALLDGRTSSLRPDQGFTCIIYANTVCRDFNNGRDSLRVMNPGIEDLRVTSGGDWNDRVRAFQCYKD